MRRIGIFILVMVPLWLRAQAIPLHHRGSSLLPPGAGKPIVLRACVGCHKLDVVISERGSAAHWAQLVNRMIARGAELSDPEIDTIVNYLSSHYGSVGPEISAASAHAFSGGNTPLTTDRINVNIASAQELQSFLGLGQKVAEAIVQYRNKNGKFKTWQDLAAVPEATPNQIEHLQDRLAF